MSDEHDAPATAGATPSADRIGSAELRVWLDWLGLDAAEAARVLGVRHDTVRRWLSGRDPVPVRVGDELQAVKYATAQAVGDVVASLRDARDPAVAVYRSDADLWAERPDVEPYPARWWRMVVARATVEVPGVDIEWRGGPADGRGAPKP